MRARGAGGARGGDREDARCELFTHPVYGGAVRARVAVPAHAMLMEELPLLYGKPPARLDAVCDEAVKALKCVRSVPERMLAFAAAPEDVRRRVLELWCGGGPEAWPRAPADSDIFNDKLVYSSDNTLSVAPAVAAWLAERVPEAAAAGGADALARAVGVFSFNSIGVQRDGNTVSALYARCSKVAHACNWAANTTFFRPEQSERGGMRTLTPIEPGATLLYDYWGGAETLYTTTVRRHMLRRSKMFDCCCEACTAPDELAALPCPACVPRDPATGLVPLSLLMGRARELLTHPLVIPDGVCPTGSPTPPAWRCDTCGGVFSAERMAALQIAAGVCRPSPRSSDLTLGSEPAALLDVARWAESGTVQLMMELPRSEAGATPEKKAEFVMNYMARLAPLVGTAHASMLYLRYVHLKALHMVTIDRSEIFAATVTSAAKRLSGRVPLLDAQLPPLLRAAASSADKEQVVPPLALATAVTAGVAAVWPRLRAAGLLRASSTNIVPVNFILLSIQIVHCLGMEREPMLALPLRAMLRELQPLPCFNETMRGMIQMCHHMATHNEL